MIGGPRPPRSCLARFFPDQRDPNMDKRQGWRRHGILAISLDDLRLSWPERELVKQLGNRLYGRYHRKEMQHG